jgi:hypothetical protein
VGRDRVKDTCEIVIDLVVLKSQIAPTLIPKKLAAPCIVGAFRNRVMSGTVQLDDQFQLRASKVGDVGSDRVLSAEAKAGNLIATKLRP